MRVARCARPDHFTPASGRHHAASRPDLIKWESSMYRHLFLVIALVALTTSPALAQTPYAGLQTRPIKALSDQQVADLKAGRGMGLALAAELNGYPGPSNLLELADQLGLSDAQRNTVRSLFEAMRAETIPIG